MSKETEKETMTEKTAVDEKKSSGRTEHKKEKKSTRSKSSKKHEQKQIERLNDEISELKDKYIRLYSEFENYRRRTAKEKIDLINTANEDLMIELLPVMDDFERAIKAMDENHEDAGLIKEGVLLIYNKLKNVTEKKGLKLMESNPGDSFDTEIHDAISQIPVPEKNLKGKIVDTIEKGYYLNDKVIRFAKVVIGA
jgi:molecular chaperone GrpE